VGKKLGGIECGIVSKVQQDAPSWQANLSAALEDFRVERGLV
jgi:hypothetical protein